MDDVSLLVPDADDGERETFDSKIHSDEILRNFLGVGITQIVFGVLTLIGGIIIAVSYPYYGADSVAEGIWCGSFILICGSLTITARFHLFSGVVIASLVCNIITAILTAVGVIVAAVSFFAHAASSWEFAVFAAFLFLNVSLTACMVLSIYLSIVFGKILNQKKQICCIGGQSPMNCGNGGGGYAMIYVPPTAQANPQMAGAYMAAPANAPTQPQMTPFP